LETACHATLPMHAVSHLLRLLLVACGGSGSSVALLGLLLAVRWVPARKGGGARLLGGGEWCSKDSGCAASHNRLHTSRTRTLGGGMDTVWAAPGTGTDWPRVVPVLRRTTSLPAGAGAAVVAWSEEGRWGGGRRREEEVAGSESLLGTPDFTDKGGADERGIWWPRGTC